jgi:Uma2 family endonuclease
MSSMPRDSLRRHRLTATEYHRMADAGILRPDARVELIEGEIIDMAPIGSRHAAAVERLGAALRRAEHTTLSAGEQLDLGALGDVEVDF